MNPALVILAAGASERLGEPKALVDFAGRTALERLIEAGACFGQALVVAGAHFDQIRSRLPRGAEIVFNSAWREGRTGSAACAAAALAGRDLCLAPVDAPLVPAEVFGALLEAWKSAHSPARGWLAPRFGQRFGHPIVLGRELATSLRDLEKNSPLRALRACADPLLSAAVASAAVLDDLDTPADLERLRSRLSGS